MSFLRFSTGECAEKRLVGRIFGRFQRAQTASEGPVSSGESPETDRTEFEMKREELRARKDRLLGRMGKLRRETDEKEAWEKYTQEFLQSYNAWDVAFDQIARSHHASYQDSLQQLLLQYEKRMHERESTEGTKEERNIDASATPEIGMEKHARKLTEAQKQPNQWKTLETGTPGYLYCFVPDKGFFAYLIEGKTFWKNEEGTARFTQIERPSTLPLLPEEEETEKRKQEEQKRVDAEKLAKHVRKLTEAQKQPNRWKTLETGTPGYLYCFVPDKGFFAYLIEGKTFWKNAEGTARFTQIERPSTLPLLPDEEEAEKRKQEEQKRVEEEKNRLDEERRQREEAEKRKKEEEKRREELEKRDPELAKFERKLEEARRHPNVWRQLQEGTEGYLYCYVEGKGFYALYLENGELQKNVQGTAKFEKTQRDPQLPRLPEFVLDRLGPVLRVGVETIGCPAYESLPDAEYIERVKQVVTTADAFYSFEEYFIDPAQPQRRFGITPEMEKKIRQHGKDLAGASEQIRSLEQTLGVTVETENMNVAPEYYRARMYSVRSLPEQVRLIRKHLDMYPKKFIENSTLKTVVIGTDWERKYEDRWLGVGGFSMINGHVIAMSDVEHAFHHELLHQADFADENAHGNNDDRWAKTAHGEEYRQHNIYGISGAHAILTGTQYGDRPRGFARIYGKTGGIDEDQATIAEQMLKDRSSYRSLLAWAEHEPELQKKIDMTKAFYKAKSGGFMDERFWSDFSSGVTINRAYWEHREREAARR